jgi:hypothetical protein
MSIPDSFSVGTTGTGVCVPVGVLVGMLVGVFVGVLVGVLVGATTVTLSDAVFPVPPLLEVTVTELLLRPDVVPVTLTLKVHDEPAGSVPLDALIVPEPAVAVPTSDAPPLQEPVMPLGVATTNPDGNVSVKPTPVSVITEFGFVMVKLKVVVPLSGIEATPKALLIFGGDTAPA